MSRSTIGLFLFILMPFLFVSTPSFSQVKQIKQEIENDDAPLSSGSYVHVSDGDDSEWPDFGANIAAHIVGGIFYGVYYLGDMAQSAVLDKLDRQPDLVSVEGSAKAGFDLHDGNMTFTSKLRGNYGIFASDIRYCRVVDYSGALNSVDWQVLMLRMPLNHLKLEYGVGFVAICDPSKTYFESTAGFDWCLFNQMAHLHGAYRWSQKSNSGSRFRQELSVDLDYEIHRLGKFRLSPSVGYTYQRYFNIDQMRFVKMGLTCRFF